MTSPPVAGMPAALSRRTGRAGLVFGGQVAGAALALVSVALAARMLDPAALGEFMLVRAIAQYLTIFMEFGLSIAVGRLLALSDDASEQRHLAGSWLIVFAPAAVLYAALLASGALWATDVFGVAHAEVYLLCALPAAGALLVSSLREILQGLSAIRALAALNAGPWLVFVVLLFGIGISGNASVVSISMAFFASHLVVGVGLLIPLAPTVRWDIARLRSIASEVRSYGLPAYWGRVFGTGTYQLDSPLIGVFTRDSAVVGLYGLAKAATAPLAMASRSVGVAEFRQMTRTSGIDPALVRLVAAILAAGLLGYFALSPGLVGVLLPAEYAAVLPLLYICAVAAAFQAAYQLPTFYLSAKGAGSVLRRMAWYFGLANIALNFGLIPIWGGAGAAAASVCANALWLGMAVTYYRRSFMPEATPS